MPLSPTLQKDRKAYVTSLTSQSSQVASWMSLIDLSDNIDFRHCFLESIINKGMYRSLAVLRWKLPYRELHYSFKY
ncbi:hypothetical protein BKA65DRAFT_520174 [Rhexocercosporidium sp. MPI-PUGE-AT-0058]|nr:hypothetical protein BKA65DRAFT_520174 [Rhexocercosporidium sp. MPI-PUGE-AT-0058]